METEDFDLSKMTVDDLFRAKAERRRRLASLPFEQKIEIVKKLQSVSRTARAGKAEREHQRQGTQQPAKSE